MRKLLLSTSVVFGALYFGSLPVRADVIYALNASNDTPTSGAGPYAQVDIHLVDSTHATATFTRIGSFVFGEMGLDINAALFGISDLAFTKNAGDTKTPSYSINLGGKVGGVGNFALDYVSNPSGFSDSVTAASFLITDKSGTWADAAHVLNSAVPEAAVHAFTSTGGSFFASGGPSVNCPDCSPTPVIVDAPEPVSMAVLGVGMAGLGYVRRQRRAA